VHVVLKARSEHGKRLNISKAHLKEWRVKFAYHLRVQGVAANATPRPFRGQAVPPIRLANHWRDRRERLLQADSSAALTGARAGREVYPPRSR
jgi:hypothetical protein